MPADTLQRIDTLGIAPASLQVRTRTGIRLDSTDYRQAGDYVIWLRTFTDSVQLRYRVLPFQLSNTKYLLDTNLLKPIPAGITTGRVYRPGSSDDPLVDFRGLDYQGSFSRGISFGNRQDLVLNSSFNLQVAGELGDGVEVVAAITDENLPIQPEGNTQQLREFDKVFIQLKKDATTLTAGDYELSRPPGYFLNYFKKLEGVTLASGSDAFGQGRWEGRAGLAISRGVFRRQQITPQEGNQGPYKLRGEAGERFIIVLAGTERVFIDGQPMLRGLEGDYIVDYNQGEITFTPRRLITKDSRITVEFEYADQRYLRSLYVANTRYESDRLELYANVYSQQDSRTATGDLQLTDTEKQRLAEAGDRTDSTLVSSIIELEEANPQRVTYEWVDTVLMDCGSRDTSLRFLRLSANAETGRLTANFTFVGSGQGNYVLDREAAANERVFRWSPPDPQTCSPTGDYEPLTRLTAPIQQQMATIGLGYRLGRATHLRGELALSKLDQNRFSPLDSDDDSDWAGFFALERRFHLSADTNSWSLLTEVNYEKRQKNFQPIAPYRGPEFLRDWNLANQLGMGDTEAAAEQLAGGTLRLSRPDWGSLAYRLSAYQRKNLYEGTRHAGELDFRRRSWEARAQADFLNTFEALQTTQLWRPQALLSHRISALGGLQIGSEIIAERSERRLRETNLLSANSYQFDRYRFFVANPDTATYEIKAEVSQRRDFSPAALVFEQSSQAREAKVSGSWRPGKALQTGGTLHYRKLEVLDSSLVNLSSGESFLGQLNLGLNLLQGAIRSNTNYTIGSGQEPRVEFTYLFVGAGQGQYVWLDSLYNNDGKIQPNEMEIAPFQDIGDYIRVSVFTDDFVRTDNNTLNQTFALSSPREWRRAKGIKAALSRFNLQSSLTINRKTRASDAVQRWNPLQLDLPDTALVALSSTQRHALNFNRGNPRFDMQLEKDDSRRRTVLNTGYESAIREEYRLRLRYKLNDALIGRLSVGRGTRINDSEFFNNKDYRLRGTTAEPQLIWQPGQDLRFTFNYTYEQQQNQQGNAESSTQHDFGLEGSFKQQIRASFNYVDVAFQGDRLAPVAFVLLNGLQPGRNFLWNVTLSQSLSRGLQLTLNYEGRKTGSNAIVHVGRAQVTALF